MSRCPNCSGHSLVRELDARGHWSLRYCLLCSRRFLRDGTETHMAGLADGDLHYSKASRESHVKTFFRMRS
jgi:hypothetical protein